MQEVYDKQHKKFNVLELGNRKSDVSDNIDFIKQSEVQYPVMVGIDCYKREFIVIK